MIQPAGRLVAREKGGVGVGLPAVLAELVDQLTYGVFTQAELLGNVLRCSFLEKHGANDFVAAVIRIGWLSKERAASGVIHDPSSQKNVSRLLGQNRAES